jgi:hypothetical protein
MVGDLGQDGAKVELRIEAVQLGRSDQAVHGGGTVIYFQKPIVHVACQSTPVRQRIANRGQTGKACAVLLADTGGREADGSPVLGNVVQDGAVAVSGKLADRPQRRECESRRAKEDC